MGKNIDRKVKRYTRTQKKLRLNLSIIVVIGFFILAMYFYSAPWRAPIQLASSCAAVVAMCLAIYYMMTVVTRPFLEDHRERRELENWLNVEGFRKVEPEETIVKICTSSQTLIFGKPSSGDPKQIDFNHVNIIFGPHSGIKTSEANIIVHGEYTIADYFGRFRLISFHSDEYILCVCEE